MQIIVTNDDGYLAPGIQELARKMMTLGEVVVVAPLEEKSAIGHGITLYSPIKVRQVKIPGISEAWAVDGTPADCVKLAVKEFACSECSMIISGINNGPNLGTDVLYSGTVSAAIEGAILGFPSLAISLASYKFNDYSLAADIALMLAENIYNNKRLLPPDTLLNVNVPAVNRADFKGLRVTKLGNREYDNLFDKRVDPRGNTYYWLAGEVRPHGLEDPEIDTVAVEQNYASITPIHFDLTNYRIMNEIRKMGVEDLQLP